MQGHGDGSLTCLIYPPFGLVEVETPTLIDDSKKRKSAKKGGKSKKFKVSKNKVSKYKLSENLKG